MMSRDTLSICEVVRGMDEGQGVAKENQHSASSTN
jgi:hypothetical protein